MMGIAEFILSISAKLAKDFVEGLNPSYIHRNRNAASCRESNPQRRLKITLTKAQGPQ
jgi:hypothetical protein